MTGAARLLLTQDYRQVPKQEFFTVFSPRTRKNYNRRNIRLIQHLESLHPSFYWWDGKFFCADGHEKCYVVGITTPSIYSYSGRSELESSFSEGWGGWRRRTSSQAMFLRGNAGFEAD